MSATILCIDDDSVVLQLHKTVLQMNGYLVLIATSGLEALPILESHAVDCVVLDFHMPGMDGAAVAAEVKRRHPHLPVIIVSGSEFDEEIAGVDAYVAKTVACSELPKTIQFLLQNESATGAVSDKNRSRAVT